jgi:DNA-binding CsgD family transcriptional regulator
MLGDEPSSDLRARLLGIEGSVLAKTGRIEEGLATIGAGLELALGAEETAAAVELYQRLANAYEHAADYRAAEAAYRTAYDFCTANDAGAAAQFCLACLGFLLWQRGDWERAIAVGREILDTPDSPQGARTGARQHLAMIAAVRGDARRARRLLLDTGGYPERYQRERMLIWERLVWAWIDELEGDLDGAADRCRGILESWGDSEARFYPVPALRWATTFLASHGAEADARACAQALAELAAGTVNPDALAALAHALGETALLDGDADRAAVQFLQAASILADLELPLELARSLLRAGTALAAAEERDAAVERLAEAYRIARRLGARPLTVSASTALAQLGERIDRRLGRRAAADLENGGLTRRELEIVRLVAVGRTNREIAQQLFLSPRTVDMHVHNILVKLGCRSRAEATFRVTELGLVGAGAPGEKTR